ncbi:hypothetical protein CMI38_00615 [Candidatus Pacearchaeota archaeon]|nr:hypothetical protein [Candidatus Pacearchaeota archaeon]|tara:strand:- start:2679 stop:3422 length:744 start_codon:yes stop_codon:yes gene_type:complete
MRKRKGQISIFIIIGILLFVGILIYLVINSKTQIEPELGELSFVIDYFSECIETVASEGVYFIALQGGHFQNEKIITFYQYHDIAYYWFNGESHLPSLFEIESEFESYMDTYVPFCIDFFDDDSIDISLGNIVTTSSILDDKVFFEVDYPLTIVKGEKTVRFNTFSSEIKVPFKEAYDFAGEIIETQEKIPNQVPVGKIIEIGSDKDLMVETIYLENDDVLYSLHFDNEFVYNFVSDYDWEVKDETI